MHYRLSAAGACAALLTGCGGATDGAGTTPRVISNGQSAAISSYSGYAQSLQSLAAEADLLDATTGPQTPTAGTAQYQGVAVFGFLPESDLGIVLAGDMTLDVFFAANEVSGQISDFYARPTRGTSTSRPRDGSLSIADGALLRGPEGTGMLALVSGEVEFFEDSMQDFSGILQGAFGGDTAGFARGDLTMSFPSTLPVEADPDGKIDIEGAFVLEAQ